MSSPLADLFAAFDGPRLRSTGSMYCDMALMVLRHDGAAGRLIFHLPRKATDPIEVEFVAHPPSQR